MPDKPAPLHLFALDVAEETASLVTEVLQSFTRPEPVSVSTRRMGHGAPWRLEAVFGTPPDEAALAALLSDIGATSTYSLEPLPEMDWVAVSNAAMPAIRTRRFFVRGPHISVPLDLGARHLLTIEAGLAFGTGHHESTYGCLLALEDLARRFRPARVLDLGTGTGLLALAAARLWPAARVVGTDIDPVAVTVARENIRLNGHAPLPMIACPGFRAPALAREAPFDLIIANILAGPLVHMAGDFAAHLAPGGIGILAGLLGTQANWVLAAYRAAGLRLVRAHPHGEWTTLVIERPPLNLNEIAPE